VFYFILFYIVYILPGMSWAAILCAIKLRKRLLLPGVYGLYSCIMLSTYLFLFLIGFVAVGFVLCVFISAS